MKNLNDLKKQKYVFTSNERSNIDSIMEDLKFVKTKEISEEGYKRLCAIEREVRTLRDKYTQRYINLLKQQHMV
jgi:polyhydroxyalkanoate synthesis regulator phasin